MLDYLDSNTYHRIVASNADNHVSDSIDVSLSLVAFNNDRIVKMLNSKNCLLFSLDDYSLDKGSSVEGFCLNYQRARKFLIPKNTYGQIPAEPILTIAIDAVLLANDKIDDETAYEISSAILKNKNHLSDQDIVFGSLSESFESNYLQYPLQDGSLNYITRNDPSFFEKHADFIGLLLTIVGGLYAIIQGIGQWISVKKKNRIDVYYHKVLGIKKEIKNSKSVEELSKLNTAIDNIVEQAFENLIKENLAGDETFDIFLSLSRDVATLIEKKRGSSLV